MRVEEITNLFLRITARSIVTEVANGNALEDVLGNYPKLSSSQIKIIKSLDELK